MVDLKATETDCCSCGCRSICVLSAVEPEVLAGLAPRIQRVRFGRGETILHEGTPTTGWVILCHGRARLTVSTEQRRHAEFTLTEIPAPNMKVAGVVGLGRAREMNGGLLGPREYLEMATILRELGRLFPDRIAVGLPWSLVNPMDDPGLSFGSCHADGTMGILQDGGVSLCGLGVSRPEAVVGNVLTRDPLAIWRDAELFVYLRTRWGQEFSGVCGACIFHRYCANVCPAYAFEVYGSFSAPFPPCQHLFEEGLFPEYCLLDSPGGA